MEDRDLVGRTLGEFSIREQIAEGGGGAVYRGFQPSLKRDVVVKVMREPSRGNHAAHERFLREARLASSLDHPFAAHVYAFGTEPDGLLWIAMELVPGITLDEWLHRHGPMPLERLVPLVQCIAAVVDAAHKRGIIHRDLKPSNVIVIEWDSQWIAKLIDFGIAKVECDATPPPWFFGRGARGENRESSGTLAQDGAVTRTDSSVRQWHLTPSGVGIGSSPYMSPEQWIDASTVGPASDIYSLGVLAYKALTGRVPFTATSDRGYRSLHLEAEVPTLGGDFSPELDRVIQRALAKKPEARHASALELAADLRAALRAEPREQLRSSAQQWHAQARPPGLLWGRDMLAKVERWTRSAPPGALSELECLFVAASQRRARRIAWLRRSLLALAALTAFAALENWSATQTRFAEQQARLAEQESRAARQIAEARIMESELEQGRGALLHGEPDAQAHLAEAYKRDPSPTTAFMLARSMLPRLAEEARFASTHGRMWWATFSPDGAQIATTDDRAAQLWDARTHQLLFTLPHGCEVYQAVYSADGARLVTAAETMVRIWDARSGALVRDLKVKLAGAAPSDYYRAAISPDGHFVAAIDYRGSVTRVWDAVSGALVAELPGHAAGFPRLAFSPDGWLAATGGGEARVFEARTWRHILTIPGSVHGLAFDAHRHLVTGTATGDVATWAIPSGARLRHLGQSGESVDSVAFSPDGQLVAAGSRDGVMKVWHASSGALRSQLNPRRSKILALEFDATSKLVLAAHADGTVVVADVAQGVPLAILDGPRNVVRTASFGPGPRVVGASWDGTARVWDATSPYRRWSSEPVSDDCGIIMSAQPDRRFVAVGCGSKPTRVWDTARDQLLAELPSVTPISGGGFTSTFPAVSGGGDLAAIARGHSVQLYALPGGRPLRAIDHGAPVSSVAFASTGRDVVSGAVDGSVLVTRDDGSQLALQASGGVDAAELLPDGRVVVSDAERRLRFYSPGGAVLAELAVPVRLISLRPDGARLLALPSYRSNAAPPLLIDLDRYRIVAQLEGHVGHVYSARWAAGARIATAGTDGTARLWDGATGRLLQVYSGSSRFLADATIVAGLVVAGDADGLLRFWDAESGAKLWTLQAHAAAVVGVHLEGGDLVTRGFTGEVSRWRLPDSGRVIEACGHHARCAIVPR